MPAIPVPPSPGPSVITFTGVPLGSAASSAGAHLCKTGGTLFARIAGDTYGVFSVSSLEVDAYEQEPDLPPGHKDWQPEQIVNGAGPISARSGEALIVTVLFRAIPSLPATQLTATVVIAASSTGPTLFTLPIQAATDQGSVYIAGQACPVFTSGIEPGQTQTMTVLFQSSALVSLSGTFGLAPGSTTGLSAPPVPVTVPAQSNVSMSLPVTCAIGSGPGNILNVPFQFACTDSRYNSTFLATIDVVFPVLPSNANYILEENGSSILGLVVKVDLDSDLISSSNGWGMQLNAYSPVVNENGWQQYVIFSSPNSNELVAHINTWDSFGVEQVRADQNFATLPSTTLPSGYSVTIALTNDAGGNITGATYAVTDNTGKSVGTTSLLIVGQPLKTTGQPATSDYQAPIVAFQFNIVGDHTSNRATLTSGSGWITYTASNALSLMDSMPTYVNSFSPQTAETANLTYGDQPSITTTAVVQSFQITSSLPAGMQERVRARELSIGIGGHALPPPGAIAPAEQADTGPIPETAPQRVIDMLKEFARQRQPWM